MAVVRNEAGDGGGWGSKICTGGADAPGAWNCRNDPRKFDSPLLFRHGDASTWSPAATCAATAPTIWGWRRLPAALQTLAYQLDYWRYPKRCALWEVDPQHARRSPGSWTCRRAATPAFPRCSPGRRGAAVHLQLLVADRGPRPAVGGRAAGPHQHLPQPDPARPGPADQRAGAVKPQAFTLVTAPTRFRSRP